MSSIWVVIATLAAGTLAIRVAGALLGRAVPSDGAAARALNALPGSLIVALVTVSLVSGGAQDWTAAAVALAVAILTRNLPVTMAAGIAAILALRHWT